MKVILVSDSHGDRACLEWLRRKYPEADAFVHCGDLQIPADEAKDFLCVRGNTDYDPAYPWKRVEEFAGHKVLVCHGHAYIDPFDPADPLGLVNAAKRAGCEAVFFGHTHVTCDIEYAGVRLLNPGSIRRPKDFRFPYPTYMVLEITEAGIEAERMIYNPNLQE
jgi:putative phosphoesterase